MSDDDTYMALAPGISPRPAFRGVSAIRRGLTCGVAQPLRTTIRAHGNHELFDVAKQMDGRLCSKKFRS
jgi:hypothetical protein